MSKPEDGIQPEGRQFSKNHSPVCPGHKMDSSARIVVRQRKLEDGLLKKHVAQ